MDFETLAAEELATAAKKLAQAAAALAASEVAAATAALQSHADEVLALARAEADARTAQAQAEAEAAIAKARAAAEADVVKAYAEADAFVAQIKADADAAVTAVKASDGGALERAREEARAGVAQLKADAEAELARVRNEAAAETAEIRAAAEAEVGALRSAADSAARANAAYGDMIEKLRNDHTQLSIENERLAAEHAALTYERADILERAQTLSRGPLLRRLQQLVARMAAASTVDDVLAAAAGGLVDEFARVAVFTARDNALVPTFHRGFDPNSGIEKVVVPLGVESFLSRAIQQPDVDARRGSASSSAPFGGTPTLCITAPIAVHGESLAVIYADDAGRPLDASADAEQIDLTKVLRAHATLRLDRLTIELKAVAELSAYAQMLLDEVEYVYDADAASKKPEADRVERLSENLRCARQIYSQRVTPEGPAAAGLLDGAIARTIERKGPQPFGRDLRTAHERLLTGEPARATAQAS